MCPGTFPDNVVKVSAPNPTTVVFDFNQAYDEKWLVYNELSQVIPLPIAWDRTSLSAAAPSPTAAGLPDTTTAGAKSVYTFLNAQSQKQSTWATSPIWSVVDGPFKLSSFTNTGQATFVPNPDYVGPGKSKIAKFIEEPFTSDTSEFNALRAGKELTVGLYPTPGHASGRRRAGRGVCTGQRLRVFVWVLRDQLP